MVSVHVVAVNSERTPAGTRQKSFVCDRGKHTMSYEMPKASDVRGRAFAEVGKGLRHPNGCAAKYPGEMSLTQIHEEDNQMNESKTPTQILKEEHRDVLHKLDDLERAIRKLDDRHQIPAELHQLARFFDHDFWIHFSKEEDALFPEMEKFMPRDAGPIGVMLSEHDELRDTNKKMQEAVAAYTADPHRPEAGDAVQKYVTYFIEVLRDHISKEDDILFAIADAHLDGAQMASVKKLFAEIEASSAKAGLNS